MSTSPDPTRATLPDLAPLALQRAGDHLRFVLRAPQDVLIELPQDYEQLLAEHLAPLLRDPHPLTAEISLAGVPALSSRQLGALIALAKVLRPRFGPIPISGAAAVIVRLVHLTRTEQLFAVQ